MRKWVLQGQSANPNSLRGVQHPSYANETLKQNVGAFLNKGETPAFWAAGHGQVWNPYSLKPCSYDSSPACRARSVFSSPTTIR
jgi:hypothetical protein